MLSRDVLFVSIVIERYNNAKRNEQEWVFKKPGQRRSKFREKRSI